MKKKLFTVLFLLMFTFFSFSIGDVKALSSETEITPLVLYAYKYTYQPNYVSKYNTYKSMGTVSLDNTSSSVPGSLTYEVQDSGTANISVGITGSVSAEVDALFTKVKSSSSASVTTSRSYTKGTKYSASLNVPAGKSGSITGYIPAMKTEGKMKAEKYDATSSAGDQYIISTTYKTVSASYVPLSSDVHFENKTW